MSTVSNSGYPWELTKENINEYDILNLKKDRNELNTNDFEYNCLGYALNIFLWVNLRGSAEVDYYSEFLNGTLSSEEYNILLEQGWLEDLLNLTENKMRLVAYGEEEINKFNFEEIKENEYLVYFRLGRNLEQDIFTDFHFVKEKKEGLFHKPGSYAIRAFEDDILKPWSFGSMIYDGNIYLFAVKGM